MTFWDFLQWPAMACTVAAAGWTASQTPSRRKLGFWIFIFSNGLWIAWAVPERAYGLLVLQVVLAVMNIRGARKNER